ncbi:MAG: phage tail protein [Alphaproteobacteria bacterium]|nr:phage tail protein [Alphaproteobacteria bacterium]
MAVLALGLAGAGLTSAIGIGASIGWMAGAMLGNLLFGSKGSNTEGSRLSDLSVQTSTYGGTIQLVYGTMRVSGNVIWSTPLKETRHVSRQGGKGGGGGATSTSYSYSASFAVGLCVGPVSTVRRVWADTKLIYDATASNTQATEKYPGVIRIHTGAEDQQPDSTIEMNLGVGNVPGYRGLCSLTFTDLQLADFANRIPNISAEVVASGGMDCDAIILQKASSMTSSGGMLDPARGTLIGTSSSQIFKYDLVGNKLLLDVPLGGSIYGDPYGYDSEGYFYHATDAYAVSMNLVKRHPETLAVVAKSKQRINYSTSGFVIGDKIYVHRSRKVYDLNFNEIADLSQWFPLISGHDFPMCSDPDGRYWQAASDKIRRVTFNAIHGGELAEWDIMAWTEGQRPEVIFWDETTGHLYFKINMCKRIVKWHPDNGYVAHIDNLLLSAGFTLQADYAFPQQGRLWCVSDRYASLVDLVSMRIEKIIDLISYRPTNSTHHSGCYEKFTHSAVIMTGAGEVKYPLERYGSNNVALSSILTDLCERAGLKQTDILTNEVSQPVHGYVMSRRTTARDAIEPLLGTYFIDAAETDGMLRFIPRGQDTAATIPYNDLGAVEGTSNDNPLRVTETRTQELELPQRIDLTHYDPDRDYQSNTQNAARASNAVTTKDQQTVELSIALSADEAAQVADKTLTSAWIGRNQFEFNLPPKWLRLDPTDVIDVLLPDATLALRLTQVDFGGNNIVACKAVAEDEIAYTSKAKGTGVPITTGAIPISTPISALVMDLPMLRAEDDGLGLYYALALKNNGTASLYKSPDALTWSIIGTGSAAPAYGWASSVLASPLSSWSWDETNNVQIALSHGTLDSKTALEILNWANIGLLGDELIQWRNATLLAENLYQLSGLLRGRRGTEWATGAHKIGERFVVLATDGFYRTPMATTEIGQTSYYKAIPSGGDWDDAAQTSQKFNAASLRCFSPVHIKGTRDGSSNLTISWVMRARWHGEWLDSIDISNYEATEAYEIDILNGNTVVRTITSNTTSASYSAADQTADFGTAQSVLSIAVYQMNSTIGRGYPGKATV